MWIHFAFAVQDVDLSGKRHRGGETSIWRHNKGYWGWKLTGKTAKWAKYTRNKTLKSLKTGQRIIFHTGSEEYTTGNDVYQLCRIELKDKNYDADKASTFLVGLVKVTPKNITHRFKM